MDKVEVAEEVDSAGQGSLHNVFLTASAYVLSGVYMSLTTLAAGGPNARRLSA